MAYKYIYYRKGIPSKYQEQLGITEFKMSLKDINKKQENLVKALLEVEFDNIFKNVEKFNETKLREYLKLVYYKAILELYNVKHNYLDIYFNVKDNEVEEFTLKEIIELFYNYHTASKNTSIKTLKNHKIFAKKLTNYFGLDKNINTLTNDELIAFKNSLSIGAGSWNNHLAFYNGMFDYAVKKQKIKENLFKLLDKSDTTNSTKEEFKKEEVEDIINSITKNKINKYGDVKLATMIQAFTGMRIEEVALLKVENIVDFEIINIDYLTDTKTKKHNRQIPIHPTLAKYLKQYLKGRTSEKLFNLKPQALGVKVNKHIQTIVTNKNKTSHSFRRSFRVHMQLKYPNMETYINTLVAHSNSSNIGFSLYGRNKTDWNKMIDMVNSLDYNIL
jgi:integrase